MEVKEHVYDYVPEYNISIRKIKTEQNRDKISYLVIENKKVKQVIEEAILDYKKIKSGTNYKTGKIVCYNSSVYRKLLLELVNRLEKIYDSYFYQDFMKENLQELEKINEEIENINKKLSKK